MTAGGVETVPAESGPAAQPGSAASAGTAVEADLGTLFEVSPAREVRTSAAANTGFVLTVLAALAVPFSLSAGVCVLLGVIGFCCSLVGLARASRPATSGSALAAYGLVGSLLVLGTVALRYAGVETAFGDQMVPALGDVLAWLRDLLPQV